MFQQSIPQNQCHSLLGKGIIPNLTVVNVRLNIDYKESCLKYLTSKAETKPL